MNGHTQSLIAEEVSKISRSNENANNLTNLFIKDLQAKNRALEVTNLHLNSGVQSLKMQMKTLPTNFGDDWKLVVDFFVHAT
jgi:hypothetical protein